MDAESKVESLLKCQDTGYSEDTNIQHKDAMLAAALLLILYFYLLEL